MKEFVDSTDERKFMFSWPPVFGNWRIAGAHVHGIPYNAP